MGSVWYGSVSRVCATALEQWSGHIRTAQEQGTRAVAHDTGGLERAARLAFIGLKHEVP